MFVLASHLSVAHHFLAELRSDEVQKDSMRFRRNMERIGEILAYEISKSFQYKASEVKTPLGVSKTQRMNDQPVLATILRAGLPFYQGFLNYFDKAGSSFIAAYRSEPDEEGAFTIKMEYMATPSLDGKTLIIIDPMLATGRSLLRTYESLVEYGKPAVVHVAAVIASREGANFIQKRIPECSLWIGDIDEELNNKSYIVPGLGDAGDLAFGGKL